jgi:hypothetical protein
VFVAPPAKRKTVRKREGAASFEVLDGPAIWPRAARRLLHHQKPNSLDGSRRVGEGPLAGRLERGPADLLAAGVTTKLREEAATWR